MAHIFSVAAEWTGDLQGAGKVAAGALRQSISIPAAMDGPGIGTNPEELLAGAAASCFLITLAAILGRRGVKVDRLELSSEARFETDGGLRLAVLVHRPVLWLHPEADEAEARAAVERAEVACMVSRALHGNVAISVEPRLRRAA